MPRPSIDRMARLMCENSSLDPKTARVAYLAMVRSVSKELRTKGVCYLPKLGVYKVLPRKAGTRRLQRGPNSTGLDSYRADLPEHLTLKFVPSPELREYVRLAGRAHLKKRIFRDSKLY